MGFADRSGPGPLILLSLTVARKHPHMTCISADLPQATAIAERKIAAAGLDGRVSALRGPCVLTVPALVPHGFRFKPGIDGSVFTVLQPHVEQLLAPAALQGGRS